MGFSLVLLSLKTVKISHNQCQVKNWAECALHYSKGKFHSLRYSGKILIELIPNLNFNLKQMVKFC